MKDGLTVPLAHDLHGQTDKGENNRQGRHRVSDDPDHFRILE